MVMDLPCDAEGVCGVTPSDTAGPGDVTDQSVDVSPRNSGERVAEAGDDVLVRRRRRRRRLLLYADYVPWPLWGPNGGPLAEDALPLSEATKLRIKAWFNAYDAHRPDWPLWTAPEGLSPEEDEQAWADEGEAIRAILEAELGQPVDYET